jgi:glycosyltransferase involved in cell wall biosynthesis
VRSLVVTTWFPDAAAPSRTPFCLEHVRAIQSAGHDVHVIHVAIGSPRRAVHTETYEGVQVTRTGLDAKNPLSWLTVTRLIARHLRTSDILHTMAFSSVLVAACARTVAPRPWLHTEHWNGVTAPRSVGGPWRFLSLLRHVLRLPQRVTGVTPQLASAMSNFARDGATTVVPCVVQSPRAISPFPKRPPLAIVGVGLLIDRKDPFLAIDTMHWLTEQGADLQYTWIGDGPLRERAISRVEEIGLADRIHFPGAVPPDRVLEYLEDAHLFFVPSRQENFFTAVAEAIVAGRPAVAPLSGGFDSYCDESNSVLVTSWDAHELGHAILEAADRFADTPPAIVAASLGDRFSRESVGKQFDKLYSELAN